MVTFRVFRTLASLGSVLSLLCAFHGPAYADSPPSAAIQLQRAEAKLAEAKLAAMETCSAGNALEQARCLDALKARADAELDGIMEGQVAHLTNMWGEQATREQANQIQEAQIAWKTYRQKHCWFDYVRSQGVNVSSRQVSNLACEIYKTYLRIEEVKVDYLHEW